MRTIFVLAAVLACAAARHYIPGDYLGYDDFYPSYGYGYYGNHLGYGSGLYGYGSRFRREPAYPYAVYYPFNLGAIAPQSVTANQISNAAGGEGATVVSSGTSNAGGSMEEEGEERALSTLAG